MKLTPLEQELKIRQIFDKHFHNLVLSASRYINDYKQAEDIVQDVFVKVWQNFDKVIKVADLKGYLYKAVKNSSLNYINHIKVRQQFIAESEVLYSTSEKSPEEYKTDEETSDRIQWAVDKLPDHWREAFVLSKYNQLKYHEIASEMNISQKTVEKYISKALHFLREELKDLLISGIFILELLFVK
jgi:RNA polymerase sigma-70 factor, ECF subfamily